MRGITNLFSNLAIPFDAVIYNRSPFSFNESEYRGALADEPVDYVVFAGSPEWWQETPVLADLLFRRPWSLRKVLHWLRPTRAARANQLLLQDVISRNGRCAFIGVGSSRRPYVGRRLERVLQQHADLLLVRDSQTLETFRFAGAEMLPCPGVFAARGHVRKRLGRIGLTLQTPAKGMIRIDRREMRWIQRQVEQLRERHPETELIAHSDWDVEYLSARYPDCRIHVVRTADEMIECYDKFDFLASTRLHGCILACSLGIPVYQLHYGLRMEALAPFPVLNRDSHGELIQAIENLDVEATSRKVLAFKEDARKAYHHVLLERFPMGAVRSGRQ